MATRPPTCSPAVTARRSPSLLPGLALLALTGILVSTSAFADPPPRSPVRENREIRSPVRSSPPPPPPPARSSPPPRQAAPPPPPPPPPPARVDRDRTERYDRDRVQERIDRRRLDRDRFHDERRIDPVVRTSRPPSSAPVVDRGGDGDRDDRRYHRGRYYGYRGYDPFYYGGFRVGLWSPRWYEPCYFGFYGPFSFWPSWGFSSYFGSRIYYSSPRRGYGVAYELDRAMGALDLDVRPEDALVFVDGQPVGTADEFDGFPRYLWLEEGTYDIAIYLPGYETIFRQITIYPGLVIDVDDVMRTGESVHPDDHGPTSTKIRDERLRREAEKQARAAEIEAERAEIERTIRESMVRADDARSGGVRPPEPTGDDIGRLVLDIVPADAAVYLDGYFLGLAGDVSQLRAGFVLEPGEHRLEVSRPGFETRQLTVVLDAGERIEMVVEMDPGDT